jgi:aminopeptidase N
LHSDGPEIESIRVAGVPASFTESKPQVVVDMPDVGEGDEIEISIQSTATLGEGEGLGIHWDGKTLFSFHEPQGARLWLVTFDDPADKATLDWHVRVDSELVVAANGELKSKVENSDGKTDWHFAFEELIPTYLMVVHASGYVVLEDEMIDGKPIRHYIQPGTGTAAWDSFETTPEILALFSEQFGEYPWASYGNAVAPFGGAMEHTTMTTFGSGVLGGSWGEIVNAHEVAHHWFGNYVTLESWPEIWLNEGFASYSEVLWYEQSYGEIGRRQYINSQVNSYFNWQQYEGVSSVYDPAYLFGGAVYDKGSIVLDMLRTVVGDDLFFEAVQTYVEAFAHSNAATSDLESIFEAVTGADMQWFFDQWIYRAGDPIVSMGTTERALGNGVFQLDVVLSQETNALWKLPVALYWESDDGSVEETVWLEEVSQVYSFCVSSATRSHAMDPDYLILMDDRREQAGPDVPVICNEGVVDPEDTGLEVDRFEGSATVTIGGCQSIPSPRDWTMALWLVLLVVYRRQDIVSERQS